MYKAPILVDSFNPPTSSCMYKLANPLGDMQCASLNGSVLATSFPESCDLAQLSKIQDSIEARLAQLESRIRNLTLARETTDSSQPQTTSAPAAKPPSKAPKSNPSTNKSADVNLPVICGQRITNASKLLGTSEICYRCGVSSLPAATIAWLHASMPKVGPALQLSVHVHSSLSTSGNEALIKRAVDFAQKVNDIFPSTMGGSLLRLRVIITADEQPCELSVSPARCPPLSNIGESTLLRLLYRALVNDDLPLSLDVLFHTSTDALVTSNNDDTLTTLYLFSTFKQDKLASKQHGEFLQRCGRLPSFSTIKSLLFTK